MAIAQTHGGQINNKEKEKGFTEDAVYGMHQQNESTIIVTGKKKRMKARKKKVNLQKLRSSCLTYWAFIWNCILQQQ